MEGLDHDETKVQTKEKPKMPEAPHELAQTPPVPQTHAQTPLNQPSLTELDEYAELDDEMNVQLDEEEDVQLDAMRYPHHRNLRQVTNHEYLRNLKHFSHQH